MNTPNHAVSKIVAATVVALSLAACGGGGGGATQLPNINPTNTNNVTPANTANGNAAANNTAASGSNTSGNSNTASTSTGSSGSNAAASNNSNVGSSPVVANPASNSNTSTNANTGTVNTAADTARFLAEAKANKVYPVWALKDDVEELLSDKYYEYYAAGFRKLDSYSVTVGDKTYQSGNIDLSSLGEGARSVAVTEKATATVNGSKYDVTRNGQLYIYQQPYSIVAGLRTTGGSIYLGRERIDDPNVPKENPFAAEDEVDFSVTKGYTTQTLPNSGKFNYVGKALTHEQTGDFKYTVDFAAKTGSGSIGNIAGGITLSQGNIAKMEHTNLSDKSKISGYGIEAKARSGSGLTGTYKLGFFGPNADEVAGAVSSDDGDVAFGGKKQ